MINIILIIAVLVFIAYCIYWYFTKSDSDMEEFGDITESDGVFKNLLTVETLLQDIKIANAAILRENLREQNPTLQEYEARKKAKADHASSQKKAGFGDPRSKSRTKKFIRDVITTNNSKLNSKTINSVIPFDNIDALTGNQIHFILNYIYSELLGYGRHGLPTLFTEYNFHKPRIYNGKERYLITLDEIKNIYEDVIRKYNISLSYNDKLEILSALLFSLFKGNSVVDPLYESNIDEIDVGTRGIAADSFEFTTSVSKNASRSYESISIVFKGLNLHLKYLSLNSQEELVRICKNIYKFNTTSALNQHNPTVIGTMIDGSRITVARPNMSSSYAFWLRKFDSAPCIGESELYSHEGIEIFWTMMKWIVKGQRNVAVTGQPGTGKTTFMRTLVGLFDDLWNIRVHENAFELNLNHSYPDKDIVAFQETPTVSTQAALNFGKKSNVSVSMIGEAVEPIQSSYVVQTSLVSSLFAVFSHHAKTATSLVQAIARDLMAIKLYTDKKDAIEVAASVLHINVHLESRKGDRHPSRITEIIPIINEKYPTELNPSLSDSADIKEFFRRITDRRQMDKRDLVVYVDGHYELNSLPTDEMLEEMLNKYTDEETAEFYADMERIKSMSDALKKKYAVAV